MKDFGIKLRLFCEVEDFISSLDEFSDNTNYGYSVEDINGEIVVNFEVLPYMPLKFSVLDEILLEVNTCYFGIGFHILVLEFIRELVEFLGCEYELLDETNFYMERDVEKLDKNFDDWLYDRAVLVVNDELQKNYSVFIEDKELLPKYEEGYVSTYTGLVSFTEFKELFDTDIGLLKNRIFVFPKITDEVFSSEGYLLYHIWNNLKDLTMVDDFDERVSLTMFMFENLINSDVKIHLPQKFARDIYKYLGVDGFSASNFIYRKVKYEVGYHLFDSVITKYDYKFTIPSGFELNSSKNTYDSEDNSIFINEYSSSGDINFNSNIVEEFENENIKVSIYERENKGKPFVKDTLKEDYISLDRQMEIESTSAKLIFGEKIFEVVVYGMYSADFVKKVLGI